MDKRIGAQLFTLRDFCKTAEDLDASFAKLQKIGYQVVQVSGIGPIPAETVKETADKYGMTIALTHRGYPDFMENLEKTIADHHTMDCKIAGLGAVPNQYQAAGFGHMTAEEIKKFIADFTGVQKELEKNGLTFGYHNHAFEFWRVDGKFIMDSSSIPTGSRWRGLIRSNLSKGLGTARLPHILRM